MALPHLVIIGGGFGGLEAAKRLARAPLRITLIDKRNYHLFQPLLYQVAIGAMNPGDMASPLRSVLRRQKNAQVLMAEARRIDVEQKRVILDNGELAYDYLLVATGATHSYFGHEEWGHDAPGLKTVEDALEIRRRIYLAYEAAERESDPALQREWLTFVVVGGGPTGVELAGALAEIGLHTLARDFRSTDPTGVRVLLIEGFDRVLPAYPRALSENAQDQLESMGVEVRTGAFVTGIDDRGVDVGDERIDARTVLWAAGVKASPLARSLGVPLDRAGRVIVEPDLTIPGHPEVFVVGDLASARSDGRQVPGVAQGAIQGGRHAADNIRRALDSQPHEPFRYRDKGSMAAIGRAAAVVDFGRVRFTGFFAWILWWLVHIMFLIGFRNRFLVLFSWAWSYLTFQRGARLITGELPDLPPVSAGERLPGASEPLQPAGERAPPERAASAHHQ